VRECVCACGGMCMCMWWCVCVCGGACVCPGERRVSMCNCVDFT